MAPPPYDTVVLADSPEIYWRLGDAAPPIADSSGNGRHGIYFGPFIPAAGLLVGDPNGAVQSSGADGETLGAYLDAGDFLSALTGVTLEMWVAGTQWSGLSTTSNITGSTVSLAPGNQGTTDVGATFNTNEAPGTTITVTAAGTGWDDGLPHHLVATADGTTARLYVDGMQVASTTYTGTFSVQNLLFSQVLAGVTTFDEVALYAVALSPAQVTAHYGAGIGVSFPPPAPPPPAVASPVGTSGWLFEAIGPNGVVTPFHPTLTGSLTNDLFREIRRAVDGLVLLPDQAARTDLVADLVRIYLRVDGVSHPMGVYRWSEDSLAENAMTDEAGNPADLIHASLGDQFIRLRAADEVARVALAGEDPSQVMIDVLTEASLPHSITGSVAPFATDVVWPAGTSAEAIVSQCADVAGHRRPWMDNDGVIRSVAANVLDADVIPLVDLGPVAGSVLITDTRLFTPNRIVVVDDTAVVPTVGTWDAPASAPNSAVKRGWVQTLVVAQQGLSGAGHAQQVAETIGEQQGARKLAAVIRPTWLLDGPVILSHRGALWMVTSWSIPLGPGATMSFDAIEVLA